MWVCYVDWCSCFEVVFVCYFGMLLSVWESLGGMYFFVDFVVLLYDIDVVWVVVVEGLLL